jgi:hypothetical protein
VIVAVLAVLVVKVAVHQIIGVIAVGYPEVAAALAVDVRLVVPATSVIGSAAPRVGAADREGVLIDVVAVDVVEVPIMEVVEVALVPDGRVATASTVLVGMTFVG